MAGLGTLVLVGLASCALADDAIFDASNRVRAFPCEEHAKHIAQQNSSGHVLISLSPPFPPGLGRISTVAARAIRDAPNSTRHQVSVGVSMRVWAQLCQVGAQVELLHVDLSTFYADRSAMEGVDPVEGTGSIRSIWNTGSTGSTGSIEGQVRVSGDHRRLAEGLGGKGSTRVSTGAGGAETMRALSVLDEDENRQMSDATSGGASGGTSGSMGGFLTLPELQSEMKRLVSRYPSMVHGPFSVGASRQGRPIELWCVAADGEACEDKHRPAVLFTALVHAREPQTLACLLHVVRRLLEGATASKPHALSAYLLKHRKLLIMPVANPDGYAWNAATSPRGGGMRRKNGLKTCSSTGSTPNDGVDVNRNFGFKWAYDNVGSSSRGCSEEYRGAGPFSEPESRAIRDAAKSHAVGAILHWHGWGNDLAFPFSYDFRAAMPKHELGLFQEFASEMTSRNHYASGRAWEVVGYTTNGEADDWGWGEEKIASFTLEVGSSRDGFWPAPSRILPIAEESVWPALYLLHAAGPQLQIDSLRVQSKSATTLALSLTMQNNGLRHFYSGHFCCLAPVSTDTQLQPDGAWRSTRLGEACVTLPPISSRQSFSFPPLAIERKPRSGLVEADLVCEQQGVDDGLQLRTRIRVRDDDSTLSLCGDLCVCPQQDTSALEYSHLCQERVKAGSHCQAALPATGGNNVASGVDDEFFAFTATQYLKGGVCKVATTKRDTLIAVYGDCSRVGAQDPLAFSNSEGHLASVEWPCVAGSVYYLFWNAEYLPGKHSFSISERCGADCVRAQHKRNRSMRAQRLTRSRQS